MVRSCNPGGINLQNETAVIEDLPSIQDIDLQGMAFRHRRIMHKPMAHMDLDAMRHILMPANEHRERTAMFLPRIAMINVSVEGILRVAYRK